MRKDGLTPNDLYSIEYAYGCVNGLQDCEPFFILEASKQNIKSYSTMEKVYVLVAVWKNGLKFEGETSTKVFADIEMAHKILNVNAKEAKKYLLKAYDEEEIRIESRTDYVFCEGNAKLKSDYIIVDANEYDDYWEGWIEEQTVIGER